MAKSTSLNVGLDARKDSTAVAHATGGRADPPVFVGAIGTRQADVDKLIRRLQGKAPELRFVYETGPSLRAVDEQVDRLARIKAELHDLAPPWHRSPLVESLQAPRGVQWVVALTVVAPAGRHHQSRQRPRAPRPGGSRVGVSPSGEGLAAHPTAHRPTPEGAPRPRLEGAGPPLQALSPPRRAGQASQRRGHRDRP